MSEKEAMDMKAALESKGETNFQVCTLGKDVVITKKMVSIGMEKKLEHQRVFTPSVVEPSFGLGRIIYCLFEHSFYTRPSKSEEEQLNVFRFPPIVAPIKCTVFPLVKNQEFDDAAKVLAKELTAAGISHIIDTTGTYHIEQENSFSTIKKLKRHCTCSYYYLLLKAFLSGGGTQERTRSVFLLQ